MAQNNQNSKSKISTQKNIETFQSNFENSKWNPNIDLIISVLENSIAKYEIHDHFKAKHALEIAYETKMQFLYLKLLSITNMDKRNKIIEDQKTWIKSRMDKIHESMNSASSAGICGTVSFEISKMTAVDLTKERILHFEKLLHTPDA